MSKYDHQNRRKYSLKVHIVLVTKYRKNIITDKIKDSLKKAVLDISQKYNYKILAMETDINHIHILLEYDTVVSVSDIVKKIKQSTTFYLWGLCRTELSMHYWSKHIFWSDGYFACSIGEVSAKTIQQYIENQD